MRFQAICLLLFISLVPGFAISGENKEDPAYRAAASLYEGIRTETLDNGLQIFLKPISGAPTVHTMVAYKVGAADEDLDHTGLSHYLEHLMFKGTDKLLPGDIDRLTQRSGGQNNAYTSEDMTVYHFDLPADQWLQALKVEADRMRNLRIDEKHEFEQEKGAVISELDGAEDEPWDLEHKAILPLLFGPKAPYGHPVIGEKAHVRNATAEVIKKHYDLWYHPNNAILVIVGGFDEKQTLAKIKTLFSPIPKAKLPDRKPIPETPNRKEWVRKKMSSKFETPRLLLGYNIIESNHPDEYPLVILQEILSSGKNSRLHQKLVEDLKLCSDVSASVTNGRYPGWFSIEAELLKEDLPKVEKLILDELEDIAKNGITPEELKRAHRGVVARYVFGHENLQDVADIIATSVLIHDLDYLKNYLPKLSKVTSQEVQRVTQKYLVEVKGVSIWSQPGDLAPEKNSPTAKKPSPSSKRFKDRSEKAKGNSFPSPKDAKRVVLPNGLTLLLLENHRLPIIVGSVHVKDVVMREPESKNGLAALMGMLLEDGTEKREAKEISRGMEDLGGILSLSESSGSMKVLSPDLDTGLDIFFDCLMNSKFPQDRLEAKRDRLLAHIEDEESKSSTKAQELFYAMIYGKHPFGKPSYGTTEKVRSLTRKECQAFYRSLFQPNNLIVAFVGDFDSEKLIDSIKKRTSEWKNQHLPKPTPVEIPKARVQQKILTDPDSAQLYMYIGHIGVERKNPDYYRLLVMDHLLGTGPGFTDRLSSNLRDRQGLAYTVSATITGSATEEPGAFTGYIGTFPDKFNAVKEGFLKEIKRIREEVPNKEELEDVKKYLIGSIAFRQSTNAQLANQLIQIERYGLGFDYLDHFRKQIESVTPEDIQTVAKKYLHPDKLIIVASGPVDENGKPIKKSKD